MTSPFEFYFPPIFSKIEMDDNDKTRYDMLVKCLSSGSTSLFSNGLGVLSSPISDTNYVVSNEAIEMMIDNKDIGKLMGSGGSRIKKIRKDSGATIDISGRFIGKKRKVRINGSEKNVQMAKDIIMEYLTTKPIIKNQKIKNK